jgi:hypothetical protein
MIDRSKEWWMDQARKEPDIDITAGVPDDPLDRAAAGLARFFRHEWDAMADEVKQMWRDAVHASGLVQPIIHRFVVANYISEVALDCARAKLLGPPYRLCTVVHGPDYATTMRALAPKLGVHAVEVPAGVLASPQAWALVAPNGAVWSTP